MKPLSRNAIIGYPAGIITGITYGLNPLFAMPLMNKGAAIESILFFRYPLFRVRITTSLSYPWLNAYSTGDEDFSSKYSAFPLRQLVVTITNLSGLEK